MSVIISQNKVLTEQSILMRKAFGHSDCGRHLDNWQTYDFFNAWATKMEQVYKPYRDWYIGKFCDTGDDTGKK